MASSSSSGKPCTRSFVKEVRVERESKSMGMWDNGVRTL